MCRKLFAKSLLLCVVLTPCYAQGGDGPQDGDFLPPDPDPAPVFALRIEPPSTIDWPKAGARISREDARRLTHNFTRRHAGVRGHLYAADKVRSLIDQEGAVALRIHFARNGRQPALVLMGVDREGDDLMNGVILDDSGFCPPLCPEVLAPFPAQEELRSAGAFITLEDTDRLTQSFTLQVGGIRSLTYSANLIREVIDHDGVEAIRFYYAENEAARPTLVGVGVNAQGHDMSELFFDFGKNCPPFCD